MKFPIGILTAVFLSGCVSATGPAYQERIATLGSVEQSKSRIVVYANKEIRSNAKVKVDNTLLGSCAYEGYNTFDINPGKHILTVFEPGNIAGSCNLLIDVPAGSQSYYEIKERELRFPGLYLAVGLAAGSIGLATAGPVVGALGVYAGMYTGHVIQYYGKECGGYFSIESVTEPDALSRLDGLKLTTNNPPEEK